MPLMDFLFQMTIFLFLFRQVGNHRGTNNFHKVNGFVRLFSTILFLWTSFKIAVSLVWHEYSVELILRDATSFLTFSFVYMLTRILSESNLSLKGCLHKSKQLASASLIGVAIGIFSQLATKSTGWSFEIPLVDLRANLFSVRSDQLACALSPLLIFLFGRLLQSKFKSIYLSFLFGITVLFLTIFSSRAVLISVVSTVAIGLIYLLDKQKLPFRSWPLILIVTSPSIFIFLDKIPGISRLLSGLGLLDFPERNGDLNLGAISTQNARENAWFLILKYWYSNKLWEGFLPGQHVVFESGALKYLSGEIEVRWPHNFFLSILFRNGVLVGALMIIFMLYLLKVAIDNVRNIDSNLFDFQLLALFLSLLIVSLVGVVAESPFGYIPMVITASFVLIRNSNLQIQH